MIFYQIDNDILPSKSKSKMNKYSSANEITSVFIPRVFANITKERITHVVENVVPLGKVERVDIVNIDEKVNRVFIHFNSWYDTEFVKNFKELLNDKTKQAKIVYDEPWYWIVLKNTHRTATGEPKMRLNLDDETTTTTPPPTPINSPKLTVTFTTGHSVVAQQKKYGVTHWDDYESDQEDGEEKRMLYPTQRVYYHPFKIHLLPLLLLILALIPTDIHLSNPHTISQDSQLFPLLPYFPCFQFLLPHFYKLSHPSYCAKIVILHPLYIRVIFQLLHGMVLVWMKHCVMNMKWN